MLIGFGFKVNSNLAFPSFVNDDSTTIDHDPKVICCSAPISAIELHLDQILLDYRICYARCRKVIEHRIKELKTCRLPFAKPGMTICIIDKSKLHYKFYG